MRLFWRILIGYWLAWALLSLGVFGALSLDLYARSLPRQAISQAPPSAMLVTGAAVSLRVGGEEFLRRTAAAMPRGEPPFVVDAEGRDLFGRAVDPATLDVARAIADRREEPSVAKWAEAPDGSLFVIFYPEGRGPVDRAILRRLIEWPWLFGVILALASLVFAGALARAGTRPIHVLKKAFDELAEGRLETRVGSELSRRHDEIGELGRHFDGMALRLEQSIAAQRQLLRDVSHELRSPLARIEVAAELARNRPDRAPEALARIERESGRLDRLIEEVLTLARVEAGAVDSLDDYVDLVELLRVICEDAAFEANAAGVEIALHPPFREEIVVRGNGELLHRAIENVVRNALQHAADADSIELLLEASPDGRTIRLKVRDHGLGVSAAWLDELFEPFARRPGSTGFGLGLSIARRAVEAHGGAIRARNHPDAGLEVQIDLPWQPAVPAPTGEIAPEHRIADS